ncbi:hypothetical protein MLD38_008392 [Melastoma candidum]|uniref:Uncharacterized protein n=1 Tax=Melastoma candidum TaxID=119954 RepID=A0ACB9RU44_9MYRT|nr:hypothetical protein MLD38_008392 [Melastoma candidum]
MLCLIKEWRPHRPGRYPDACAAGLGGPKQREGGRYDVQMKRFNYSPKAPLQLLPLDLQKSRGLEFLESSQRG